MSELLGSLDQMTKECARPVGYTWKTHPLVEVFVFEGLTGYETAITESSDAYLSGTNLKSLFQNASLFCCTSALNRLLFGFSVTKREVMRSWIRGETKTPVCFASVRPMTFWEVRVLWSFQDIMLQVLITVWLGTKREVYLQEKQIRSPKLY